jgi:hypothetical protein
MFENTKLRYEVRPCLLVPDAVPALARLRTGLKRINHEGHKVTQRNS